MTDTSNSSRQKEKRWKPQPRPGNPIHVRKTRQKPTHNTTSSIKKHKVVYHKRNDLSEASALNTADPEGYAGHGGKYVHCETDDEYEYENWKDTLYPSSDDNLVRGMAEALSLIIHVASNGPESVNHESAFPGVQFLSTIRNNHGELPPNVLSFMEYIDYHTRNDGLEKAEPIIQPS